MTSIWRTKDLLRFEIDFKVKIFGVLILLFLKSPEITWVFIVPKVSLATIIIWVMIIETLVKINN